MQSPYRRKLMDQSDMMGVDRTIVDEKKLLEGLSQGNADAFTTLYYRYGGKLHAHLRRMIKSEDIAREIFQDVFMKIWEFRGRIDVERPFGAYLYRIAENKVYDHFRAIARERRMAGSLFTSSVDFHTDTENEVLYGESLRLINKAIDQLPPARKQIYQLCKVEGKSYEEIALLLGVSTSTINDHIVKANRFLKKVLAGHMDTVVLCVILFQI